MKVIPFIAEPDDALFLRLVAAAPILQVGCRDCDDLTCADLRVLRMRFGRRLSAARIRDSLRCRLCAGTAVRVIRAIAPDEPGPVQAPALVPSPSFHSQREIR